jgi:hypothetical protein
MGPVDPWRVSDGIHGDFKPIGALDVPRRTICAQPGGPRRDAGPAGCAAPGPVNAAPPGRSYDDQQRAAARTRAHLPAAERPTWYERERSVTEVT